MKENRAISLLKSLKKEELKWFQKFVESPYHNPNQKLVALYGLLRKEYPDFSPAKTSPEILFKKLFTRRSFDAPTIRLLSHRLANLLEEFLVTRRIQGDEIVREKLLIKSLGERNAYDLFEKKTRKLLNTLDDSSIKDANYYRHKSDLHIQYYGHPTTNRQRKDTADLLSAMDSLDDYFAISKTKLSSALKAREHTLSEKYEIKYLEQVLEKVRSDEVITQLYKSVLDLQEHPNDDYYFNTLRALFEKNILNVNLEDRRVILQVLLNFCTRKINLGISEFTNNSYELYKIGLDYNCIIHNNEMTESTFINIIYSAVYCKGFIWADDFVEEYKYFLDPKIRGDALAFGKSLILFNEQKYFEAIEMLINHKFSRPFIIINSKTLLIRCFAEYFFENSSYYDLAIAQVNTFTKYVRKNEGISDIKKIGLLNFSSYLKKILTYRLNRKNTNNLVKQLNNCQNLVLKSWLLSLFEK